VVGAKAVLRPRVRQFKTATERLLQDGRVVDEPTQEERVELQRLAALGLVEVSWRRYFLCVDHHDDEDLVHAYRRDCDQKIELRNPEPGDDDDDVLQHEDDLQYPCPQCGRVHWPMRRQRTLYDRAIVSMPPARVIAFFAQHVRQVDARAEQPDELPTFRLRIQGREVYACLLDECLESRFATRGFATSNRIVYVTSSPRLFADRVPVGEEWLQPLALHEIAAGGAAVLQERLAAQALEGLPRSLKETADRPYLPGRRPEPRVHRVFLGIHDLMVGEATISLDGVEVLSARARMQVALIKELADRRIEDLRDGRKSDQCRWVLAKALLTKLGEATKANDAETVSKYLNRARTDIASKYEEETGRPLGPEEIIESSAKGFRLNPARVAVRYA